MIAKFSLAAVVAFALSAAPAAAYFYVFPNPDNPPAQGVFRCEILDDAGLTDAGELQKGKELNKWFKDRYHVFTFNAADGFFKAPGQTTHWVVLRPGSSEWDLLANLPGVDPLFNLLRIEVWKTPIGFTLTDGKDFFSGLCKRIDE